MSYPFMTVRGALSAIPSMPDAERSYLMAQKNFDILREATDSRYRLSMVVGRRAAQLKKGVPSTVTNKVIPREKNAVSAAMEEIAQGTGVVWGKDLPSFLDINGIVEQDRREVQNGAAQYSIMREESGRNEKPKNF